MKLLVIADTHGNYLAPLSLIEETGAELLIHLGDEITDAKALELLLEVPVLKVPGNCDLGATEPRELLETIAGTKILITHGDRYWVKNGLGRLQARAAQLQAAVVLFGHTHQPLVRKVSGTLLVNPGTLMSKSLLRSYAVVTITPRDVSAEIFFLP